MTDENGTVGSSLSDFLSDEGTLDETTATAVKRVLSWQLSEAMAEARLSKNQMAKAMHTSRSQLDRILNPDNSSVQLDTIIKAARVLGRKVRIELV